MIHIHIHSPEVEVPTSLRAHVERRLGVALGRFEEQIGAVSVRFSNTRGFGDRSIKLCRIDVDLSPYGVQAEDAGANLFVSVNQASARISRSVALAIERDAKLPFGAKPQRT